MDEIQNPPVIEDSPVEQPPIEEEPPAIGEPPVGEPPVEGGPPVEDPPTDEQTVIGPPAEQSQNDDLPADNTAIETLSENFGTTNGNELEGVQEGESGQADAGNGRQKLNNENNDQSEESHEQAIIQANDTVPPVTE
ncbi:MAG: hypothetical protein QME46_05605 [Thermoanaerobacteraceae bacterium]|nr:hypothetical protein [Thermoanaerobacteraceae bacterium]